MWNVKSHLIYVQTIRCLGALVEVCDNLLYLLNQGQQLMILMFLLLLQLFHPSIAHESPYHMLAGAGGLVVVSRLTHKS